jgi:hypothetical protein
MRMHYNPANDPAVTGGIQEAYGFKRGDKVEYTNDHGAKFAPHTVIGFVKDPPKTSYEYTRMVYIDIDCPWFPVDPASLRKL